MVSVRDTPSLHHRRLLRKVTAADHERWLSHTANTHGCVRPVRLTGSMHTVDTTTGEILDTRHTATDMPDGVLYVPCGDRRASVCPPCAETYRADTYQLIKAGLTGGKGVPTTVTGHPAVFVTLTAPSFGPVHTRVVNTKTGKIRPCRIRRDPTPCPHGKLLTCTQRHTENAPCLGRPICLNCYDHAAHVVWNAWAGELWRRTTQALNRAVDPLITTPRMRLRVSYGKVAEYQRRGVVHFHALIRLDMAPDDDPDAILTPPSRITTADLAELVADTVATTAFDTPDYADTGHSWPITWGTQLDVRPVNNIGTGTITSEAVAAYLAKYATKATEATGLPATGRMTPEAAEHYSDAHTHLGRLVAYAWQLGTPTDDLRAEHSKWLEVHDLDDHDCVPDCPPAPLEGWKKTYGRLRRWTHMLGFGGHFATKSRRYSTTHKALRAQRRVWQRAQHHEWRARHHLDNVDDTTLVICDFTLAGIGWNTTADAQLAASAAARAREHRALRKQERVTA